MGLGLDGRKGTGAQSSKTVNAAHLPLNGPRPGGPRSPWLRGKRPGFGGEPTGHCPTASSLSPAPSVNLGKESALPQPLPSSSAGGGGQGGAAHTQPRP